MRRIKKRNCRKEKERKQTGGVRKRLDTTFGLKHKHKFGSLEHKATYVSKAHLVLARERHKRKQPTNLNE